MQERTRGASREPIRAAVWGTGRIGVALVRAGLRRPWLAWVGGAVFDPATEGRDLGEIAGVGPLDVAVTADADALLARDDIDLVIYAGLGPEAAVADRMEQIVRAGKDAVTVSGLVHPRTAIGAERTAELHAACVEHGRRAIGAGLNPGFVLDVLPVVWSTCIVDLGCLRARRVSEMKEWGPGIHALLGIGRRPDDLPDVESPLALDHSLALIGDALGLAFDRVDDSSTPLVAPTRREHRGLVVEPGTVHGYVRRAAGVVDGAERVVLEWTAVFDLQPDVDGMRAEGVVQVEGDPWLEMRFDAGFVADPYPATAARGLSVIPGLLAMPPGLYDSTRVPLVG